MSESTGKKTNGKTGLRVTVDPKRCIANAKCTTVAPGIYVLDEETGVAYIDDWERATVEQLFAGARACPTQAIIIEQHGRRVFPQILTPMFGDESINPEGIAGTETTDDDKTNIPRTGPGSAGA